MLAVLVVATAPAFVAPPRGPSLLSWAAAPPRAPAAVPRVCRVRPSASDGASGVGPTGAGGKSVSIEGVPLSSGSPVICGDDYGNWWAATVIDVRVAAGDADILVHYDGCDPAWDEWLSAASGRVLPRPEGPPVAEAEETWRDVGEGLHPVEDAELLARLRAERQAKVDQWQYNTLCGAHGGEWVGTAVLYRAEGDAPRELRPAGSRSVASRAALRDAGRADDRAVTLWEGSPDGAGPARELELVPASLRAARGHMAVGGAFTVTHATTVPVPDSDPLVITVCAGHDPRRAAAEDAEGASAAPALEARVRCTFGYAPFAPGAGGALARALEYVEVAREVRAGGAASAPSLEGPAGRGLYDHEAQASASGLYSVYCDGGITVVAPMALSQGTAAAVSVDWDAGTMRYQADRRAGGAHDGSFTTLELTEAVGDGRAPQE